MPATVANSLRQSRVSSRFKPKTRRGETEKKKSMSTYKKEKGLRKRILFKRVVIYRVKRVILRGRVVASEVIAIKSAELTSRIAGSFLIRVSLYPAKILQKKKKDREGQLTASGSTRRRATRRGMPRSPVRPPCFRSSRNSAIIKYSRARETVCACAGNNARDELFPTFVRSPSGTFKLNY